MQNAHSRSPIRHSLAVLLAPVMASLLSAGCLTSAFEETRKKQEEQAKIAAEKEKAGSIIRKTTQEIGKYDPAAGRVLSDSKVRATSPMFYAMEAYGPMVEQISKLNIDQWVITYNIEHDKWPNYEEFMRDIIKANNVQLPVLPAKMEYQYDEANHKLVTVYPEGTEAEPDGESK